MLKKLVASVLALLAFAAFAASIDVNKATLAELESVKGVGPAMATRILDERKKSSFSDWNDMISRVKGVGEGNAAKFSAEGLTVNGASFAGTNGSAKKDDKSGSKAAADKKLHKAASGAESEKAKAEKKVADVKAADSKTIKQ